MSGHSDSMNCPTCGSEMDTYNDYKPYDNVSGSCYGCGFSYYTTETRLELWEINDMLADRGEPLLTEEQYHEQDNLFPVN